MHRVKTEDPHEMLKVMVKLLLKDVILKAFLRLVNPYGNLTVVKHSC